MSRNAIDVMGEPKTIFNWIPGEMVVIVRLPKRPPDDELDTLVEQVLARNPTLTLANHKETLGEAYEGAPQLRLLTGEAPGGDQLAIAQWRATGPG